MSAIGKIVTGIAIGVLYSFTFWKLWGWFAVPTGAPQLGFLHAWGLYTLASSVLLWSLNADQKSEDVMLRICAKGLISGLTLLEGWCVHSAMVAFT